MRKELVAQAFRPAAIGTASRAKALRYGVWALALVICCSAPRTLSEPGTAPGGERLLPVSIPDLSRTDEAVQAQIRNRFATVKHAVERRGSRTEDLAHAYGQFAMVLHAAELLDAAEPAYLNAQTLAPGEVRWPYHLAHLYKTRGATDKAATRYQRVLELNPDEFAALVWLGRLELDRGRPDAADPLFTRALARDPRSVAALAGLGRAALARRDYAAAAGHLEQALAIDPQAESLHAPLALAYRGLGDLEKAAPHARQWRNREILLPDPLREELDLTLESSLSYELRGVRALEAHDWTTAAEFFRKGLALSRANTPLKRSLTHKLGTALYLGGDRATALTHFENTVRLAPPVETIDESVAKAHYSIALIKSAGGQDREAIDHLAASVKYQPNYPEAHLALGDTLRRSGRPHDALAAYKEVIAINPRAAQARLGYAIALVQLKRYRETRQWLDEAVRRQPDDLVLRHTLARLLAAAPDAGARDGERAMAIVQELFKTDKSTELGATMAMALAELGEYDKAAAIQRGVIDAAARGGLNSTVGTMTANLKLYERRQPCRTPWAADDPIFGAKSAKTEKLRN